MRPRCPAPLPAATAPATAAPPLAQAGGGPPHRKGVREGDSVVIHEADFEWQDDQSDAALYQAFKDDMRARGRTVQGVHAWPKGAKDQE